MDIRIDDLTGPSTRDLLTYHLLQMHSVSPPGSVLALDISGLSAPGVSVWTAWIGEQLAGIGALKALGEGAAEIKSMRTHPDHLRQGVARSMLTHLISEARARGLTRLSLETGTGPAFDAALALYMAHGFLPGAAFSDYQQSSFNQFLHLDL